MQPEKKTKEKKPSTHTQKVLCGCTAVLVLTGMKEDERTDYGNNRAFC